MSDKVVWPRSSVLGEGQPAGTLFVADGDDGVVTVPVGAAGQQLVVRSDGTLGYIDTEIIADAWGASPSASATANCDAIKNALDAAAAAGGRTVRLAKAAAYPVTLRNHPTTPTMQTAVAIPPYCELKGQGRATSLFLTPQPAFVAGNPNGYTGFAIVTNKGWTSSGGDRDGRISDLTVDGNAINQPQGSDFYCNGIHLLRTQGWKLRNVGVKNCRGYGNGPQGGLPFGSTAETFHYDAQLGFDTTYENCDAYGEFGALGAALTSGQTYNSLTAAKAVTCPAGAVLTLHNGKTTQQVTVSAAVDNSTTIPVATFTAAAAFAVGSLLLPQTASGFASNQGTLVKYLGANAWGLSDGNGFAHYQAQSVYHAGCGAWANGTHGFNSEWSTDVKYTDCMGGLAMTSLGTNTFPYSVGKALGNAGSGFVSNGQVNGSYRDCTGQNNGSGGLTIVQTTGYPTPTRVSIDGGAYTGNVFGIAVNGTSGARITQFSISNRTRITDNTTADLNIQPQPGYVSNTNFFHADSVYSFASYMVSGAGTTNPFGCDVDCYVTCGASAAITSIRVGGSTTGITIGNNETKYVKWPAGRSIQFDYTGTPTWRLMILAGAPGS